MTSKSEAELVKAAQKNCEALIKHLLSFCLNLVRFEDPTNPAEPSGLATGFLVANGYRKFVFTAGHAARRRAVWFWETDVIPENERKVHCIPLGPFTLLNSLTLRSDGKSDISEVDVAWCDFDVTKLQQDLQKDTRLKGRELTCQFYQGPLDSQPILHEEPYTFAAWNRTKLIPAGALFLERSPAYETCMTFTGINSEGNYIFKLAREHQRHDYYRGASGAPIAAPDGTIVSIVLGGCEKSREIFGLPLAHYTRLLHLF